MQHITFEKKKNSSAPIIRLSKSKKITEACFLPSTFTSNLFEVFLLEKAKGQVTINDRTSNLNDFSSCFMAPHQKRSWKIDPHKTEGIHLTFPEAFLSTFFGDRLFTYRLHYFYNAQHPQFFRLNEQDFNFINSAVNEIEQESKNQKNDSTQITKALLYLVFTKLNSAYAKIYALSSETQGDSVIYSFKDLVERNIRKFHRVDDYCDILQIQRNKLNRIVKTHFGTTAKETIHLRMLQEIKMELLYSKKTVVQIANELNFSEPNNMTRFFNRLEGMPPSLYREKHQ